MFVQNDSASSLYLKQTLHDRRKILKTQTKLPCIVQNYHRHAVTNVSPCRFVRVRRRRKARWVDTLAAIVGVVVAQWYPRGGRRAVVGRAE